MKAYGVISRTIKALALGIAVAGCSTDALHDAKPMVDGGADMAKKADMATKVPCSITPSCDSYKTDKIVPAPEKNYKVTDNVSSVDYTEKFTVLEAPNGTKTIRAEFSDEYGNGLPPEIATHEVNDIKFMSYTGNGIDGYTIVRNDNFGVVLAKVSASGLVNMGQELSASCYGVVLNSAEVTDSSGIVRTTIMDNILMWPVLDPLSHDGKLLEPEVAEGSTNYVITKLFPPRNTIIPIHVYSITSTGYWAIMAILKADMTIESAEGRNLSINQRGQPSNDKNEMIVARAERDETGNLTALQVTLPPRATLAYCNYF